MTEPLPRWRRRLARVLAIGIVAGLVCGVGLWWFSLPPRADGFYRVGSERMSGAGTLLRSEPFVRGVPPGARAWRILYTSTGPGDAPVLASALVVVPQQASDAPYRVVAWAHGTTGVARGCAPSLLPQPFAHLPGLDAAIAQGWAVVATDYIGLGTDGVHGYLIGEAQARAVLDALRAARALRGVWLSTDTVIWGHSQGGNAALWSGIRASSLAPDSSVLGVAALAPASDLPALVRNAQHTPAGRILTSYIVTAYSAHYPELSRRDLVRPMAAPLVRDMARRCLADWRALVAVAQSLLLGGSILREDPGAGALGARLAQNVPTQAIPAPVLLAQGGRDDLVPARLQRDFAARRCAEGQSLQYREYPDRDHLSLVAADSALVPDLLAWTRDRFARRALEDGCDRTPE